MVEGAEAVRIELANRVVRSERVFDEAMAMARAIEEMSPEGVRITQAHLARTLDLSKEESLGFAKQVREMMQRSVRFQDVAKGALEARRVDRGA